MTRRAGMSLTEVLVALFIVALGVIAILTMFPLGAVQMAYAVRDDRSALAAINADGYMRWYWRTYAVEGQFGGEPIFAPGSGLFDNPAQLGGNFTPLPSLSQQNAGQLVFPSAGQVSYPLVVDPVGILARPGGTFGESPGTYVPRCTLTWIQNQPQLNQPALKQPAVNIIPGQPQLQGLFAYRVCSLTDGLGYNDNGAPTGELEMRYNWLWVLQRPQFINDPAVVNGLTQGPNTNLSTANMTVVVFDRRALGFPSWSATGYETVIPNVTLTSGLTGVTITLGASLQAQDLKPGTWIMDATITPNALPYPIRQANFYRVVSVVPLNATQVNVELQTPIAPPTGYSPLGYSYTGTLVVLRGVSGVFVRAPLTPY